MANVVTGDRVRTVGFRPEEPEWFGLRGGTTTHEVEDVWVEVDLSPQWRAAYRLLPYRGGWVIGELRVMPRDEWPGRHLGEWRAEKLGAQAASLVGERRHWSGKQKSFVDLNGQRRWRGKQTSFAELGGGVTARVLRAVPFGPDVRWTKTSEPHKADSVTPTSRRSGWPDRQYAAIAAAYVEQLAAKSRKPVAEVATRMKLDAAQVRDAIHTARARGLLTATTQQGRPGGELTPKALVLLRRPEKPAARRRSR